MSGEIIGIDPGLNGAVCFWRDGAVFDIQDMPTVSLSRNGKARREIDIYVFLAMLNDRIEHAFIEQAWPRPTDGAMASFKFGAGYGQVLGVLAARGCEITKVSPQAWKRDLRVGKGKDAARERASELIPSGRKFWPLKKHDGRADSALIALWGHRAIAALK